MTNSPDQSANTVAIQPAVDGETLRAELCTDKRAVFAEVHCVLRPGGWLQFADIANGRPVPTEALQDIDLWTG